MTRNEQNNIIITKFQARLIDTANVQDVIEKLFSNWFRQLVQAGTQQMQQAVQPSAEQPANEASAPAEGG